MIQTYLGDKKQNSFHCFYELVAQPDHLKVKGQCKITPNKLNRINSLSASSLTTTLASE